MSLCSFLRNLFHRRPSKPVDPPPPPPPPDPPPVPKAPNFLYGFFFEQSERWGDFSTEVRDSTTLLSVENVVQFQAVSDEPAGLYWPLMREFLNRELSLLGGRKLIFDLKADDPFVLLPKTLKTLLPYEEQLALLTLADEPGWDQQQTERKAREVLQTAKDAGFISPPKLGVVLSAEQILNGDAHLANGLEWIGVELYLPAPGPDSVDEAVSRLRDEATGLFARIPERKKILVVAQSYDRNGRWSNMETLSAMQWATYKIARELGERCVGLLCFAYGRPGGVRDYPELLNAHRAIWDDISKRG